MGENFLIALLAVFVAGIAIATQAPMNARLGGSLGDGLAAAMVSFGVGFLLLLILVIARGTMPDTEQIRAVPWWAWSGGALGAYYVWTAIYGVPRLGVLSLTAALILGQLVGSLLLDAFGAFGLPVRGLDWQRVLAALLVAAGVALSLFR
ncbi:DMT family transporter [Sedimentitalea sp. HM32M-2]|uniref:DMT family transporter n=1 Tax=Sedimentitalea sp. HM32M-2 TaxID=3351566 RepID=UPI003633D69F